MSYTVEENNETQYVLEVAEIAEHGGSGGRDDGKRQTEAEALHTQLARDTREVVADGSRGRVHHQRHEHVQHLQCSITHTYTQLAAFSRRCTQEAQHAVAEGPRDAFCQAHSRYSGAILQVFDSISC